MSFPMLGLNWVDLKDAPVFRKGYERGYDFAKKPIREGCHDPLRTDRASYTTMHQKGFAAGYNARLIEELGKS